MTLLSGLVVLAWSKCLAEFSPCWSPPLATSPCEWQGFLLFRCTPFLWMSFPHVLHPPLLSCLTPSLLHFVSRAAVYLGMRISLQHSDSISFGHLASWIIWKLFLSFWGIFTLFSIMAMLIYIPTDCINGPVPSNPCQRLLSLVFLIMVFLTRGKWHFTVAWLALLWWLVVLSAFSFCIPFVHLHLLPRDINLEWFVNFQSEF